MLTRAAALPPVHGLSSRGVCPLSLAPCFPSLGLSALFPCLEPSCHWHFLAARLSRPVRCSRLLACVVCLIVVWGFAGVGNGVRVLACKGLPWHGARDTAARVRRQQVHIASLPVPRSRVRLDWVMANAREKQHIASGSGGGMGSSRRWRMRSHAFSACQRRCNRCSASQRLRMRKHWDAHAPSLTTALRERDFLNLTTVSLAP